MGDGSSILTEQQARHLLRRTSFEAPPRTIKKLIGATRAQATKKIAGGHGTSFAPRVAYDIDDADLRRQFHDQWLAHMLRTRHQFEEKMVLFWHDHFSTNNNEVMSLRLMARQHLTLRRHCLGNVANASFKDFVKAMSRDAALMTFLDTIRNTKGSPNENFARELQELFTLGAADLNGTPNYSQADIVQIARAFTGWRYRPNDGPTFRFGDAYLDSSDHDDTSPKAIYGGVGNFGPSGRDITEVGVGAVEIDALIDIIFQHRDSDGASTVARHIAGTLLSYLAAPQPPKDVIDDVIAASNFDGARDPRSAWQLNALLRAILEHDYFFAGAAAPRSIKWPVDYVVTALRTLKVTPAVTSIAKQITVNNVDRAIRIDRLHVLGDDENANALKDRLTRMGQTLFEPPSVFGWEWETAWINAGTLLERGRVAVALEGARPQLLESGAASGTRRMTFQPERLIDPSLTDPAAIVDAVTTALSISSQFPAPSPQRDALIDYLTDGGSLGPAVSLADRSFVDRKLRGLFTLVLQSPAFHLQ